MHYLLLLLLVIPIHTQTVYNAYMTMTPAGYEFQPKNESLQRLTTCYVSSSLRCAQACVSTLSCRTFDYDSSGSSRCRLYEADQTTGENIPIRVLIARRIAVTHQLSSSPPSIRTHAAPIVTTISTYHAVPTIHANVQHAHTGMDRCVNFRNSSAHRV